MLAAAAGSHTCFCLSAVGFGLALVVVVSNPCGGIQSSCSTSSSSSCLSLSSLISRVLEFDAETLVELDVEVEVEVEVVVELEVGLEVEVELEFELDVEVESVVELLVEVESEVEVVVKVESKLPHCAHVFCLHKRQRH